MIALCRDNSPLVWAFFEAQHCIWTLVSVISLSLQGNFLAFFLRSTSIRITDFLHDMSLWIYTSACWWCWFLRCGVYLVEIQIRPVSVERRRLHFTFVIKATIEDKVLFKQGHLNLIVGPTGSFGVTCSVFDKNTVLTCMMFFSPVKCCNAESFREKQGLSVRRRIPVSLIKP
jgi:hypothetical protein